MTPRLDRLGNPISGKNRVPLTKPLEDSSELIFDKPWIKEPEGLTPTQSWLHWMNENALCVEMGIPLLAHPKHTYSKIGGLTDSESEYSSDSEDELDVLIQYSKQVESDSAKNLKFDQDSLPNLCNTRFIKGHKPSNHIRARIKSHVYTTE